jgi:ubiquinone/menaquinone biosynthesis C-methylase UbiE
MRTIRVGLAVAALALSGAPAAHAQLGTRTAEEWVKTLESPNRLQGLKIPEVIAALKLTRGQLVADVGAGTGVFTLPLARAVRPGGTVYAVEVDEKLLEHITETATEQGVANVQAVFGEFHDPLLPVPVDLAFIHDVLHHIEKRPEYLKNLASYVKPGGRIAVIEFRPGQGGHRTDHAMQVSEQQAGEWMTAAGLKQVEEINLFEDKWFRIYQKLANFRSGDCRFILKS